MPMLRIKSALRGAMSDSALAAHRVLPDAVRYFSWGPLFVLGLATGPRISNATHAVKWAEDMANLAADVLATKAKRVGMALFEVVSGEDT